jgi:hypothetical protein
MPAGKHSPSEARTFVYDIGLDKHSLYDLDRSVYDLTHA